MHQCQHTVCVCVFFAHSFANACLPAAALHWATGNTAVIVCLTQINLVEMSFQVVVREGHERQIRYWWAAIRNRSKSWWWSLITKQGDIKYIKQTIYWSKISLESKPNISDSCFMLLPGTLPVSIQLRALMLFSIQYESNMESLDCSYIVFDAILRGREIKRCVIAVGWPVCPPDVVWEMLIDLLMKSGLLLSALSLRESVTLEGTPAYLTRW